MFRARDYATTTCTAIMKKVPFSAGLPLIK
jgi:hypothetical protein